MKRCENCKITFSDSVNFCTECGQTLVYVPDTLPYDSEENRQKPKRKKKRSIWKVILITLIVIVIGFVVLLNYIMNAATYLRVEPNMLVADKNGGETVVDVDYDGYVWVINHIPDWIEVEEYEQSFNIKAEENLTGHNREGSITVQSGDFLAQVVILQKGQATYIKTSKTSLHFDEDGGRETITVDTDGCDYTVEYSDFLSVSTNDDEIKIKAYSNSDEYRSGYVTISEDNIRTLHTYYSGWNLIIIVMDLEAFLVPSVWGKVAGDTVCSTLNVGCVLVQALCNVELVTEQVKESNYF